MRRLIFPIYFAAYRSELDEDLACIDTVAALPGAALPAAVVDRMRGAAFIVNACSAWYAITRAMLRLTFWLSIAVAAAVIALHWRGALTSELAAVLIVAVFIATTVKISFGWRFDLVWLTGWAAIFYEGPRIAQGLHVGPGVAVILERAFSAGFYYALVSIAGTAMSLALFAWTTRRKKTRPEEEVIETLTAVVARLANRAADWAKPAERRFLSRQLDWVADRLEFDFFRPYAGPDPAMNARDAATGRRIALAIRELKSFVTLSRQAATIELRRRLRSILASAASGDWRSLPLIQDETFAQQQPRASIKSIAAQIAAVLVPAAVAAILLIWLPKTEETLRNPAVTIGLSLAFVNFLALINPSGFDKQVTAAKTIADAIGAK